MKILIDKKVLIAIIAILGFVAIGAGFFLYITWQHNPQCEFHCEGVINWADWLPYGLAGGLLGLVAAIPFCLLGALVFALITRGRK